MTQGMKNVIRQLHLLLQPIVSIVNLRNIPGYFWFFRDYRNYRRLGGVAKFSNLYPCLNDKTDITSIDYHYFYQAIWGLKKIKRISPELHVDVGSDVRFVGMLTVITKVLFVDIRPPRVQLDGWSNKKGTILDLPFKNDELKSVSCISVAEHIGLGRYGDPIDPEGTRKACIELSRVIAPGGDLYFGLPVGIEKTCFNAHRIHSVNTILGYFPDMEKISLSAVDENGLYIENADTNEFDKAQFINGLFHFRKRG